MAHAGLQRCALFGQPLFATDPDVLAARLAARLLFRTERAELFVQADLVAQFAEHDLGIDRVVEKAEARDMVRDQVIRIAQVGKRADNVAALFLREVPFLVVDHVDHDLELGHACRNELRQLALLRLAQQVARRLPDVFGGGVVFYRSARLVHDRLETCQVVVA